MDKIAICAIFKDEARYLLEWLAFHRLVGVDSFVLYDNSSTDGGPELIRRSDFAHNVTLIDWPGAGVQIAAYQDFCTYHAAKFDWAAMIDLDEFIMPVGDNTIREPLTRAAYSDYASILLQWFIFGPSGHQRRPDGLVIESYTRRLLDSFPNNLHVKSLVRGKAMLTASTTPHIINVDGPTCDTRGQTVLSYAQQPMECHDVLAINHYFTRSREDWVARVSRGRIDVQDPAAHPYPDSMYYEIERDTKVEERDALRFVPQLRAMVKA